MSPILGRTSGVTVFATSLERKRNIIVPSGGGASPHDNPTGATHFWDWSASHDDQIGSVDFDSNSSAITLNSDAAGVSSDDLNESQVADLFGKTSGFKAGEVPPTPENNVEDEDF